MNVLVVSGFLGAGKTTFIRELARRIEGSAVVFCLHAMQVGLRINVPVFKRRFSLR